MNLPFEYLKSAPQKAITTSLAQPYPSYPFLLESVLIFVIRFKYYTFYNIEIFFCRHYLSSCLHHDHDIHCWTLY